MRYEDSNVKEEQMLHISFGLIKHFYQVTENICSDISELIQNINQLSWLLHYCILKICHEVVVDYVCFCQV
jgi:hypothetical protein